MQVDVKCTMNQLEQGLRISMEAFSLVQIKHQLIARLSSLG